MDIEHCTLAEAFEHFGSTAAGLSRRQALARLAMQPAPTRLPRYQRDAWLLFNQFRNPLVLLLLVAMLISLWLGDRMDAVIVLVVILMSTFLGFWQERRAADALAALLALIRSQATVLRDGQPTEVPVDEVVRGDVVLLKAGDTIPGDGWLLEAKDLFVDESSLTGESFPAEKKIVEASSGTSVDASWLQRISAVYQGTHVVSGTAKGLMVATGTGTKFGKIAASLRGRSLESEFELGLRRFGEGLVRVTLVLVIAIFALHVFYHRPVLDAFLFAMALAVGITPELLPAIVSITLARGAQRLAAQQVIVRRLAAIENLGSMSVLCSDKTGTLTEGTVKLLAAVDADGQPSELVKLYAVLNATFESGFANPIDKALRSEPPPGIRWEDFTKFDEVPYDFIRKRLSVVVAHGGQQHLMITKGAVSNILAVCTTVAGPDGPVDLASRREAIQAVFEDYSQAGHRVLGLAIRDVTGDPIIDKDDEHDLCFLGFLTFDDPPKAGAAAAVQSLRQLGVELKVITGDNRLVARQIGQQMGIASPMVVTGEELHSMTQAALIQRVRDVQIFAETEPNQKERILLALRQGGEVVGYLGDGINDASALHAADVGISVDDAVDVAKEAADLVLLQHDLAVLAEGVRSGRHIFANTMKYIFITTSANFGNMFSMAGASIFLPFLPLLPKQILLNNLLSDLPAFAIATDRVDRDQLDRPRRWDQRLIRHFMIVFGLVSSVFDFLTFGVLIFWLHAQQPQFQTAWFIESLMTELFIVMVIRTRRPFIHSRPGGILMATTLLVAGLAVVLPYTPLASLFGLVPLPLSYLLILLAITLLYLLASEWAKQLLFARLEPKTAPQPAAAESPG
jgi:Mg2+-importing ATPase